ncbi:FHA domain-containing serine/threonine-protein kinase [Myxosarcina sp. GI1]|uniref:FHA domain-containing serine/threonine-protein kinase n=1 Tax=Myxosarcina sp. GI1 TaxID=1541065 RepID=UPI0005656572|nr:FHA domain-containing serine/threonine-protein kinase [Myxosarcina sp. GI1]
MVILTLLEPQTNHPLQQWHFKEKTLIRIGRAQNNDIVLDGYFQVSRQHLELRLIETDKWQAINRGTNGTSIDKVAIDEAILQHNNLLRLAENGPIFKFELESALVAEPKSTTTAKVSTDTCDHSGNPVDSIFCRHCGAAMVEEERFVGPYQILKTLGRGGMGTTYLVWDKNRTVKNAPLLLVLKEMNANMIRVPKAKELFEREARILKSLNHPGIPQYYDFFVDNDHKYLIMELIHGHNLEQFVYQRGAVDRDRITKWMMQVCQILTYLHNLDPPLVHRDIKPANLMLRNLDSRLMLLDFGAVKELGTSLNTRIGVEGYSAPEQYRGKPCIQSDIYGIGTTIIFLLTGKTPMQYYRYRSNKFEFDIDSIPNLSVALAEVLKIACQPKPQDRYQTAEELFKALSVCL